MTLRLPEDLKDAIIAESHMRGDLAKVLLFALRHVNRGDIQVSDARRADGLALAAPQMIYIGAKARGELKQWAEEEGVSLNLLMIEILTIFFRDFRRSKQLRDELRSEIKLLRGKPILE
ncbi:hypothetical protein ACPOL_7243 (plasmid) [Acidisarcina polymorpha]|uniref:Uncharacterized protein n=1 Tax=Acidisarcina polymorpha TaxID=2211140 RepID=A0A2Z5GB37_9BACT|nr:hypothetical protein [Acidisarcina polymorpha]AXC16433.1 hypothetical protein ACPOL_7243 [Acidisarcina polymorpha]